MNTNILSFLFLLFQLTNWSCADKCSKLLGEIGDSQGKFVQCATTKSVPVTICSGCEDVYTVMQVHYNELIDNKNCSAKYFDKDRINLVATVQSILTGLWSKAYCDDCFSSNNSGIFDYKQTKFESCLANNKKQECAMCVYEYTNLNNFYKDLDRKNNGKVCYDMQDAMNRTRSYWSKDLKCCKREKHLDLFLIGTIIVALLPILFYGGTFIITKRRERNHDILNNDVSALETSPSSSSTVVASTSVSPQNSRSLLS